jgi:hypothetical protein
LGLLTDLFAGRSLEAYVARARQRLQAGDFDEAARLVEQGLARFPDAEALREVRLSIRRAQGRAAIRSLREQVERDDDPLAHEQLIALYLELDMHGEARRAAQGYAQAYPDRDTPQLLLGEMLLQAFFEDLQARDAQAARDHLVRCARLNTQAIKPRLLLAELYFCTGADRALATMADALDRLAPDDEVIRPVVEASRSVARADGRENVEALFAQVEVQGNLVREPKAWPLRTRRNREQVLREERAVESGKGLVERGEIEELVVVRRSGTLVTHVGGDVGPEPLSPTHDVVPQHGLPAVVAGLARDLSRQVRELDLGTLRRCTIQGPFGVVVLGELGGLVAAVRHKASHEPHRVWERLTVALQGGSR